MANKPLKSIKYPGLPDTYTFVQIGTESGQAADAKVVGDDVAILDNGGMRIPADFEIGSLSNGVNQSFQAGVRTVDILPITADTVIRCDSGYRYLIAYYQSDGTFIEQSALTTARTFIPAGSYIRIVIRALPDQTLAPGTDPVVFTKHVTFLNPISMEVYKNGAEITGHTDFIDGVLKGSGDLQLTYIPDVTMSTSGTIYTTTGATVVWAKVYKNMVISFFSDNNGIMEATNCRYGFYDSVPVNGSTTTSYGTGYKATVTKDCYIAFMRPSKLIYSATFENAESVIYKVDKMDSDIYGDSENLTLSMIPDTAINNTTGQYFAHSGWTAGTTEVEAGYDLIFYADGVVTNCRYTIFDGAVDNNNIHSFGTGYGTTVPNDKSYNIMISTGAVVTQFTIVAEKTGIKEKAEGAWAGKKIVWFGTSIPAGVVVAGGVNGVGSYPERIGKMLGATVYNEAVGSSRVRAGSHNVASENDPLGFAGMSPIGILLSLSLSSTEKQDFIDNWDSKWSAIVADDAGTMSSLTEAKITQFKNTSWDIKLAKYLTGGSVGQCDLYVFDHGFNDAVLTYQFDEMSDNPPAADPTNRSYFLGAMGYLFKKILDDNYKAKILVIGHYLNADKQGTTGAYLIKNGVDKCCAAQEKIATQWGVPIIKTWEYMGISNNVISKDSTDMPVLFAYFPDGTHPASDTTGYATQYYAEVLYPHIKNIR